MKRPSAALGRGAMTLADQGLSSLTNFAVAIVVARQLGAVQLGAFSVAFTSYLLALAASRALSTDPLMIRFSAKVGSARGDADAASAGTALAVGLAGGLLSISIGVVIGGPLRTSLVVLGLLLPGLLLQDAWRYVFFSRGRPSAALVNDAIWVAAQFVLMVAVIARGGATSAPFLAAWGLGAAAAAIAGMFQARNRPRPSAATGWWRTHRRLSLPMLGEYATGFAGILFVVYLVAALRGLAAAGTLRAALTLVGPLTTMFLGLFAAGVAEGVRLLQSRPDRFVPLMRWLSVLQGAAAIAWCLLLVALPDHIGASILGRNWSGAQSVLGPIAVYTIMSALTLGAVCGLRALGAASVSFRARLALVPLMIVGSVTGTLLDGAFGAATGLAVANVLALLVWWTVFRSAANELVPVVATVGSDAADALADGLDDIAYLRPAGGAA